MSEWDVQITFDAKNAESMLPQKRRLLLKRISGEQKSAYLTLEIYPEYRPRHPKRYFGTWQFSLDNLEDESEVFVSLDSTGAKVERGGVALSPSTVLSGRLGEDGLYRVYVVLAERETYDILARTEYLELIPFGSAELDPLDHWPGTCQRRPLKIHPACLSLKAIAEMLRGFITECNIGGKSRVLDVGCAHKPYYPFFAPTGCDYLGTDIFDGQFVDRVWQPDTPLPFETDSFDFAISTQVLEHAADPKHVLSETRRVLKPGGRLFFSAPFAWEEHDYPADYWRFSSQGLRHLFAEFSAVEVTPAGNSAQCMMELLNLHDNRNRKPGLHRNLNAYLRNWWGEKIATRSKDFAMPSNYVVTATK